MGNDSDDLTPITEMDGESSGSPEGQDFDFSPEEDQEPAFPEAMDSNEPVEIEEAFEAEEDGPELTSQDLVDSLQEEPREDLPTEEVGFESEPTQEEPTGVEQSFVAGQDPIETPASSQTKTEKLTSYGPPPEIPQRPEENIPSEPSALDEIRDFSDRAPVGQPVSSPAYPFHLRIDGFLTEVERERLLEILNQENMGIREIELEPQMEAGKILLPRISEFAGIMIVQALRDSAAIFSLFPSDRELEQQPHTLFVPSGEESSWVYSSSGGNTQADHIPLIAGNGDKELEESEKWKALDAVSASFYLTTTQVETTHSTAYQDALDSVQRKLKYAAYAIGADAVVQFNLQLNTLASASKYHLLGSGTAVKKVSR